MPWDKVVSSYGDVRDVVGGKRWVNAEKMMFMRSIQITGDAPLPCPHPKSGQSVLDW